MKRPLVILVSGAMNSGKDHFVKTATKLFKDYEWNTAHESFAADLKGTCQHAFNPLIQHLNTTVLKTIAQLVSVKDTPPGVADVFTFTSDQLTKELYTKDEHWWGRKNDITRTILQAVGTDIVRKIDPDYWAKSVARKIGTLLHFHNVHSPSAFPLVVLISDWRFPNEADVLAESADVVTVRLLREKQDNSAGTRTHSSETSLQDEVFNYVIDNRETTLEEFEAAVENVVVDIVLNHDRKAMRVSGPDGEIV